METYQTNNFPSLHASTISLLKTIRLRHEKEKKELLNKFPFKMQAMRTFHPIILKSIMDFVTTGLVTVFTNSH